MVLKEHVYDRLTKGNRKFMSAYLRSYAHCVEVSESDRRMLLEIAYRLHHNSFDKVNFEDSFNPIRYE